MATTVSGQWWSGDGARHELVTQLVSTLADEQTHRDLALGTYWRMFAGFDRAAPLGMSLYERKSDAPRLRINVTRSIIETAMARFAKAKAQIKAMTTGGAWSSRYQSRKLTQLLLGIFDEVDVYRVGVKAALDACWGDLGAVLVYEKDGRPAVERIPPYELRWDDSEGIAGDVRSIHRVKLVPRSVAASRWRKHAAAIKACPMPQCLALSTGLHPDLIELTESWHLPSGHGEDDGCHSIVCQTETLDDDKWDRDSFPIAFFRWSEEPIGFAGRGLCSILAPVQLSLNRCVRTLENSLDIHAPFVLADSQAKVNAAEIMTNELFRLVHYSSAGTPPQVVMPPAVSPDLVRQIESLIAKAHDLAGVSQMSTSNRLPPGLSGSGESIRQWNDTEDGRFALVSQRYEQMFVDIGGKLLELCEEIDQRDGGLFVHAREKTLLRKIKWKDVRLDRDNYVLSLMPASLLPNTPAGRLATVQELYKSGLMEKEPAQSLLSFPDLESAQSLANADIDLIDAQLAKIMEPEAEYEPPDERINKTLALRRSIQAYERAKIDEADEDTLELLRLWIADVEGLMAKASEDMQGPAPAPPQMMDQMAPPMQQAAALPPGP